MGQVNNASGTMLRRYVHGSNAEADDPLVWYEGSAVSNSTRRYLHADPRGSIVAVTQYQGTSTATNSYDEYGIPDSASGNDIATKGRFRYTGQAWIPELGMYYYKARIYSPTLGRFLQTDPIGYDDQFNLYAYVANDPVNMVDPTGMCTASGDATKDTPSTAICHDAKDLNLSGDGAKNIIGFEGATKTAYKVGGDVPTIGIGHTDGVKLGDTLEKGEMTKLFMADVAVAESTVEGMVGDLPVSQQEFDALVDLAFNVGETKLNASKSPGLNQAIADGDYAAIGANLRYTRGRDGPSPGLVDRSDSRQAIFSRGNYSQGVNRYNALLRRLRGN